MSAKEATNTMTLMCNTEYTLKSTLLIDKLLQTFPAVPVTLCTLIFVQLHLLVLCDLVFQ